MLVKLIRATAIDGGYWVTFWDEVGARKIECEVGPEFRRHSIGSTFDVSEVDGVWRIARPTGRSRRTAQRSNGTGASASGACVGA